MGYVRLFVDFMQKRVICQGGMHGWKCHINKGVKSKRDRETAEY